MGKITFIASCPEIAKVVETVFHEMNDDEWELEIMPAASIVPGGRLEVNGDVVIVCGVLGADMRRLIYDVPVVELAVTGYDVMRAVVECRLKHDAARLGAVGSREMLCGVRSLKEMLGLEIAAFETRDGDEAETAILNLRDAGVGVIIGGTAAVRAARRLGMPAVLIKYGPEGVYHALAEAKRSVRARRSEEERTQRVLAILEYAAEGIVAVDGACRINLVNKAALKLTGVQGKIVGQQVDKIFPQLGLSKPLIAEQAELGEVAMMGGQQIVVNRAPIAIGGRTVGAVATFQPISALQELEGRIREKIYRRGHVAKGTFDDIQGASPAIKKAIAVAKRFSEVDSNVLILGESGTGKEIFAQSIHNASSRRRGPFVAVNCAALPESILESELFGYVEGAFTGAMRGGKVGLFELAHRGTIFLDEVSEISPKLQAQLLRVLQEREIMRLGDRRVIPVDLRVIAATNRDLHKMLLEGKFREDLYYRLNILRISLPPLRERTEDIIPLMTHFLGFYSTRFSRPLIKLTAEIQNTLLRYSWRGNVRELRNVAERLVALTPTEGLDDNDVRTVLAQMLDETVVQDSSRSVRTKEADNSILLKVLEQTNFHYGKAAAMLGISRTTLWRRLKQDSITT